MSIIDAYIVTNPVDEVYLGSQLIYGRYHPHTHAVLDEAQRQGFKKPLNINALDAFIRDLVNSGIWDLLDIMYLFASDLGADFNFRRINLINPNKHLSTPYGGLIWTSEGVKGNGSNGYIDTNFNPNLDGVAYKLNDASRFAVLFYNSNGDNSVIDGLNGNSQNRMYGALSRFHRINQGMNSLPSLVDFSDTGLKIINRTSASSVNLINTESQSFLSVNSISVDSANQLIFKALNSHGDIGLSLYGVGSQFSITQSQEFRRITNKYLKSINLNEIA